MRGDTIIEKQRRSLQNHASLVCLDNHIRLSPLQPGACLSVYLHFVPFREHFNTIELVQLFDKDTGSMTSLRDVLDVYVQPSA
ncbi:hypothetical protein BDF19DRAFT_250962 [Syncephalis fuscata]|nr:hypothetical protein BDF19DRAFT_250962 [Syncephalis fuscata]